MRVIFRAREAETQLEAFKRRFAEAATMGRPQSASTYVTKVVPTATVSSKPVSAPGQFDKVNKFPYRN
jgi:hypothetical protein